MARGEDRLLTEPERARVDHLLAQAEKLGERIRGGDAQQELTERLEAMDAIRAESRLVLAIRRTATFGTATGLV